MKYAVVYDVAKRGYKVAPSSDDLVFVVAKFVLNKYVDEYDFWCMADDLYQQGALIVLDTVLDFVKSEYPDLFSIAKSAFYNYVLRIKEKLGALLEKLEVSDVTNG